MSGATSSLSPSTSSSPTTSQRRSTCAALRSRPEPRGRRASASASAAGFVDNLVRHGDVILFSAAVPHQGGEHHVNEQPPEYWRELFARPGLRRCSTGCGRGLPAAPRSRPGTASTASSTPTPVAEAACRRRSSPPACRRPAARNWRRSRLGVAPRGGAVDPDRRWSSRSRWPRRRWRRDCAT